MDERKHHVERPDEDEEEEMIDLNKRKIHQLSDTINFGKHKGKTVEQVLKNHPDYLLWAQDAIEWFEVDEDILEQASERDEQRRRRNREPNRARSIDELFRQRFDDGDDDDISF